MKPGFVIALVASISCVAPNSSSDEGGFGAADGNGAAFRCVSPIDHGLVESVGVHTAQSATSNESSSCHRFFFRRNDLAGEMYFTFLNESDGALVVESVLGDDSPVRLRVFRHTDSEVPRYDFGNVVLAAAGIYRITVISTTSTGELRSMRQQITLHNVDARPCPFRGTITEFASSTVTRSAAVTLAVDSSDIDALAARNLCNPGADADLELFSVTDAVFDGQGTTDDVYTELRCRRGAVRAGMFFPTYRDRVIGNTVTYSVSNSTVRIDHCSPYADRFEQ